jgi:hypothetical protein
MSTETDDSSEHQERSWTEQGLRLGGKREEKGRRERRTKRR